MLHKILNLEGAKIIKKEAQQKVKGGSYIDPRGGGQCSLSICAIWDTLIFKPNCNCDT
ncbi:hypothetical protein [uncultured Aquimarina sp.]|uniref:hypothetical protein n=1 Tax=uncultured Aquimarina sp. TaxID=575652 RepID=UPI00260F745F|nr:hypothetical protein [uncultured Aquimarina sp.]